MAKLDLAPTKSNLLLLRKQLAFAEEGYDLLEQKRQILIFELMSRLARAQQAEQRVAAALAAARAALAEATLDIGSAALDHAALGVSPDQCVELAEQHLMGLRLPRLTMPLATAAVPYGIGGTSASTDAARRRFLELLPLLAELAELENAVLRLARELRKTQRRCNALSKNFLPAYRESITYIAGTLEERERESFILFKMIRDRLAQPREPAARPEE
jgi:V/A-type H+/Na+-transporting ATPase subunit D